MGERCIAMEAPRLDLGTRRLDACRETRPNLGEVATITRYQDFGGMAFLHAFTYNRCFSCLANQYQRI
jgi:hypothetical protein